MVVMKNKVWQVLKKNSSLLLIVVLIFGCESEPQLWKLDSEQQVITEYVDTNPEFSEFSGILEATGLNSLLAVRGPFTVFLPSNEYLQAYYTEKGVSSYTDFDEDFLEELALNHVIGHQIETGDIGLGAIREPNAIGDYIVSEFQGADIILNKYSKIIKRDIRASNGVVHHIDKVLDPVTKSVFEVLAANPSFSLFTEGLVRTTLKDTLEQITFPYGDIMARTRFTIMAVADSTFNRYGITNINELINYFTDAPDSITYLDHEFYRYMEYHCLANTYYLSDLETKLYPTITYDNNLFITVDDDYKLNIDNDKNYTKFVIEQCNYPGKNGTVHTVAGLLPTTLPKPQTITWETTDHFEIKESDFYGKHYKRWFDGQNTFPNIKWEGDYLLYYYKDHNAPQQMNWDCLSMSGWWWVEVTTPKIMKGKYKISGNIWANNIDYAVYVDGVNTGLIKRSDPANTTTWAEVDWDKTERHKIKVVATSPGLLFWDTVIFTPITN